MFGQKNKRSDIEFYTVFDSKAGTYAEPFPAPNKEVLIRDFANAFRKEDAPKVNRYYINAEDFSVFKIGSFDSTTGQLTAQNMEHVINLHDLRAATTPGALSPT